MLTTISYKGIPLEIEGDYHKGSPPTSDHPGDIPEYDIKRVWYKGVDITEFIEAAGVDEIFSELSQLCLTILADE